jgi:uncharacterized protein (TIGR02453 family)
MTTPFTGFSKRALTFLRQLKKNNRREWFLEHKETYESDVLGPMKEFVEEVDVRLATLAPEITGSPKKSIFRIYRDVRFSKDKSPYKTNVGCWFTHSRAGHGVGSETHGAGAGFYFHLEPGGCFVAGGIWMPPRPSLMAIREAIAARPRGLQDVLADRKLRARFGSLSDERRLTRVPKPWDATHPAADLLRYASFTMSAPLTDAQVGDAKLLRQVEKDFTLLVPFVRWLNASLGHQPLNRR